MTGLFSLINEDQEKKQLEEVSTEALVDDVMDTIDALEQGNELESMQTILDQSLAAEQELEKHIESVEETLTKPSTEDDSEEHTVTAEDVAIAIADFNAIAEKLGYPKEAIAVPSIESASDAPEVALTAVLEEEKGVLAKTKEAILKFIEMVLNKFAEWWTTMKRALFSVDRVYKGLDKALGEVKDPQNVGEEFEDASLTKKLAIVGVASGVKKFEASAAKEVAGLIDYNDKHVVAISKLIKLAEKAAKDGKGLEKSDVDVVYKNTAEVETEKDGKVMVLAYGPSYVVGGGEGDYSVKRFAVAAKEPEKFVVGKAEDVKSGLKAVGDTYGKSTKAIQKANEEVAKVKKEVGTWRNKEDLPEDAWKDIKNTISAASKLATGATNGSYGLAIGYAAYARACLKQYKQEKKEEK